MLYNYRNTIKRLITKQTINYIKTKRHQARIQKKLDYLM